MRHSLNYKSPILAICILFFLALRVNTASAQQYHSIMEHDSVYWYLSDFDESGSISYGSILMYGDSILNRHHYKKLFLNNIHQYAPEHALIREENKKVYFRALGLPKDTIEDVVCDFNLKVGDTFNVKLKYKINNDTGEYEQVILGSIDSIFLRNGQYRKTYQYYGSILMCIDWAEEFGSLTCLPFVYNYNIVVEDGYQVEYVFTRNTLIYCYPPHNNCTSSINDKPLKTNKLKIYPNPGKEYICVADLSQTESNEILQFSIYDMSGKLLLKDYLHDDKTIAVSVLSPGSYILKIKSKRNLYEAVFQK